MPWSINWKPISTARDHNRYRVINGFPVRKPCACCALPAKQPCKNSGTRVKSVTASQKRKSSYTMLTASGILLKILPTKLFSYEIKEKPLAMELKDFIKHALLDIVNGVEEANKEKNRFHLSNHMHDRQGSGQKVEFDVSVMITASSENDVQGGIKVAFVNIGMNAGKELKEAESNQNIHKIKFDIFISET